MEIKNSTILITGGNSGIGLELVKQLSACGPAAIIITGRNLKSLADVKKLYPNVHTFQSDVSDPAAIAKLCDDVVRQFPQLNIIINNAGVMRNLNLLNTSPDITDVTTEINVNLSGAIQMVQQFLPHLLKQSSAAIINVTSGLAFVPFPISPVYSASKAGLRAYTRVLRLQLKDTGIKVFELAPPSTETPLQNAFAEIGGDFKNMPVDKMVQVAIKGIKNDTPEIKPGLTKVFKVMSRLAPDTILNLLNKTLQKAKAKNLN